MSLLRQTVVTSQKCYFYPALMLGIIWAVFFHSRNYIERCRQKLKAQPYIFLDNFYRSDSFLVLKQYK